MSSLYYNSLQDKEKARYSKKLSYNGSQLPDPLDEDLRNFAFNSKRWPNVSIFDIYSYLVVKHQMYSKHLFADYTCLPCFNYIISNKVEGIKCFRSETGVCVVTAKVEASQKAKKIHFPWIIAKFDGEVISGHCTCMAGLGETCSHVGATLFFIEKKLKEEREKPSSTSQPCKWKKTSKNVEPSPVPEISFTKPNKVKPDETDTDGLARSSLVQFSNLVLNAKAAVPCAPILSFFSDSDGTETGDEEIPDVLEEMNECSAPTFIEKVRTFLTSLPHETSMEEKQKAFEAMFTLSQNDKENISVLTSTDILRWKAERKGRITASNFSRVLKCNISYESLLFDIMGYRDEISSAAIAWGKAMEKTAQDKFYHIISPLHVNLCIQSTGLLVDIDEPYLGATPDGLVTCDCCEDHILEIKCPFLHKSKRISDIKKGSFFLDEKNFLKENHYYYEQVQGEMAISGVSKGYFVTFTEKELHYQIVEFDELRWENSKRILKKFFFSVVFPEIVSDTIEKGLKAAAKECLCASEKSTSVVSCRQCTKTFHRSCVVFRKRSAWSCNECKNKNITTGKDL